MSMDTFEDQIPTLAELADLCEHSSDHTLYDVSLYADLLEQANQPENAIKAYRKAIALCDSVAVDDRFHQDLLVSLGRLLTDGRQFEEASQRLREAIEIADQRVGDGMRRYSAYDALAAYHSAIGDDAEATRCHVIAEESAHAAAVAAIGKWQAKRKAVVLTVEQKHEAWNAKLRTICSQLTRMEQHLQKQSISIQDSVGTNSTTSTVELASLDDDRISGDSREERVIPDAIRQVLALVMAGEGQDVKYDDVWQCWALGANEQNQESFNSLIEEINSSFGEMLNICNDGGLLRVRFADPLMRSWLLGLNGGKAYVSVAEGHQLFGQWADANIRAVNLGPPKVTRMNESALPFWLRFGVIHMLEDFQHRYRALEDSGDRLEPIHVGNLLLLAIDRLNEIKCLADIDASASLHQVVRGTLPHLANCLSLCNPKNARQAVALTQRRLNGEHLDRIGSHKLMSLFSDSYATDDLQMVVRWIFRSAPSQLGSLVDEMLAKNDFVIRWAIAEGTADRFAIQIASDDHRLDFRELYQLLTASDINRVELGCYSVASVAERFLADPVYRGRLGKRGVTSTRALIRQVAKLDLYFARSALGDLLLRLQMLGLYGQQVVRELTQDDSLRAVFRCHWEHTQLDTKYVLATGTIDSNSPAIVGIQRDPSDWHVRQSQRGQKRMAELKKDSPPLYHSLLREMQVVGCGFESIQRSESDLTSDLSIWASKRFNIDPSGKPVRTLFETLFLHPLWSMGEKAANLVKTLATSSHLQTRIIDLETRMLVKRRKDRMDDWRIDFCVAEVTFLLRSIEEWKESGSSRGNRMFDQALQTYYNHPISRVRANLAENYVADLMELNGFGSQSESGECLEGEWVTRLCNRQSTKMIDHWLRDSDCWVLEHLYRLFQILNSIKVKSPKLKAWLKNRLARLKAIDSVHGPCILSMIQSLVEEQGMSVWAELDRRTFVEFMEVAKRSIS